jgi:hypothetical protein
VTQSSPSSAYTCDFDIKDVPLVSPNNDVTVSLPRTFSWQKRSATTNDSYALYLYYQPDPNLEPDPAYLPSLLVSASLY